MWNLRICFAIALLVAVASPQPGLVGLAGAREKPRCKGTKKWYEGKCRYQDEIARLKKKSEGAKRDRKHASTKNSRKRRRGKTGMVKLEGGSFSIGCAARMDEDCQMAEQPRHEVELDSFWLDKTEVTVGAYRRCVKAEKCTKPITPASQGDCNWTIDGRGDHPVNCVTWEQARTFCEWRGARLPTEAEWERAAAGGSERRYPWVGLSAHCIFAVMQHGGYGCSKERTWPTCGKPKGMTEDGLCDMAGNVSEWVVDWYDDNFYVNSSKLRPVNDTPSGYKTRRGGSWIDGGELLRVSSRQRSAPTARLTFVGFRCAASVKEHEK